LALESAKSREEAKNLIEKIKNDKNSYREDLYKYVLKRQATDPAYPVSEAAKHTNVVTGIRTKENLEASKNLFDLTLWIDRKEAKSNSTDQLGPEDTDKVIDNNGTLDDLRMTLMGEFTK